MLYIINLRFVALISSLIFTKKLIINIFVFNFFLLILFYSYPTKAEKLEITEIYIDSKGNNQFEAKIKAHESGMRRVFFLLTDKAGMSKEDFQEPNYKQLNSVFHLAKISDEILKDDTYKATVNYTYNRMDFYRLLIEIGNQKIQDSFNEYLIIPVLKQKNILHIWEKNSKWNDFWLESRNKLSRSRLIQPEKTLHLSNKITDQNLFFLNYDDFAGIVSDRLFKKVMIISAELFTDRDTTQTIMKIKRYILSPTSKIPSIIEEEITLNHPQDLQHNVNTIIDKTINEFGISQAITDDPESQMIATQKANELKALEYNDNITLMLFEAFDNTELQQVATKLKKVKGIDDFAIKNNSNNTNYYFIRIITKLSDADLAEALYMQSLSYRKQGNIYKLINIQTGA